MREIPILFSTQMVQAILDGRKTQTRRMMSFVKKLYPEEIKETCDEFDFWKMEFYPDQSYRAIMNTDENPFSEVSRYGNPGDVLWVKETFFALGKWVKNGFTKTGKQKYKFIDETIKMGHSYMYLTDSERPSTIETKKDGLVHWYKRPSIFMPKTACRIKLLVKNIRVERLNDISGYDAVNEGILKLNQSLAQLLTYGVEYFDYSKNPELFNDGLPEKESYRTLWESINGKDSWEKNPWVWVIEFSKI